MRFLSYCICLTFDQPKCMPQRKVVLYQSAGVRPVVSELCQEFQSTREAKRRFLVAYSLMLDFYGIKLLDKSGNVARASNWQERFQHLNE